MKYFLCVIILFSFVKSQSLDDILHDIYKKNNVVGASVVVTYKEKAIFQNHYGKRDVERNLPVTQDTYYRIASISKMITAISLMQLVEKGKCSLKKNISDYLGYEVKNPYFPQRKITLQQLLAHTSGLRDCDAYFKFLQRRQPLRELIHSQGKYFSKKLFDGKNKLGYFTYANVNYGIIATIVERITGQRFDVYCRENIFLPLGLSGSFHVLDIRQINDIAVLYRYKNGWQPQADNYQGQPPQSNIPKDYKPGTNAFVFSPQGGLRITAADLAHLLIAHYNSYKEVGILKAKTVELMQKVVWQYDKTNGDNYYGIFNSYALGNHTTTELLKGETLIGHPGEAYGLISDMYFSPSKHYGIIFISNGCEKWKQGKRSGWYLVEEQVFDACFAFIDEIQNRN